MSQFVSPAFLNAQASDGNLPAAKVQLVLGDYCNSAAYGSTSTATDTYNSDWPATGPIDGDRTFINGGPASGADNQVGKSIWQSASEPDIGGALQYIVDFNTGNNFRTINRVKIYHYSQPPSLGHGLRSYRLYYYAGLPGLSSYICFAATADLATGAQTVINTNFIVDTIDFPDLQTRFLRLEIVHTQTANDNAFLVEIEAYRLVDISDRVKSIKPSRRRDYKLVNPMAATIQIGCINTDRFFSLNHTPTTAELAAGFVNSELHPGVGIIVQMGFNLYKANPELVTVFTGEIDSITISPITRDAVINGRDYLKHLINRIDSTNLKLGQDIGTNIQYILNRSNIANSEMSTILTGINIDYFFTDKQSPLDTIRNLVQACGDATFYFDELGIATFKDFSIGGGGPGIVIQKIFTSKIDFDAGSYSGNITSIPDQLQMTQTGQGSGEVVGAASTSPGFLNIPASPNVVNSLAFKITMISTGTITQVNVPLTILAQVSAPTKIRVSLYSDSAGAPGAEISGVVYSNSTAFPSSFSLPAVATSFAVTAGTSYWIVIEEDSSDPSNCQLKFTNMQIASGAWSGGGNTQARYVLRGSACPGRPGATTAWASVEDSQSAGPIGVAAGSYTFMGQTVNGVWTSPVVDTGANTTAFGSVTDFTALNGGTVAYQTQSSPDGIAWEAYQPVSVSGLIASTVHRYLRLQATLSVNNQLQGPVVLDITISWTTGGGGGGGGGSIKYPSTVSFKFSFDSSLLDARQELADNLGGDSSILNDVAVQAQPLILTGNDSDTVWQGTVGTPPQSISGSTPLVLVPGTYNYPVYIPGGMDISRMSGFNPAAASIAVISGQLNYSFTIINPTLPVLQIVVQATATLSDLRIIGKKYQNANYLIAQTASNPQSIELYGDRQLSISNQWIVSISVASSIAASILSNFVSPTAYIPSAKVRLCPSIQLGDRVTVVDDNLDLSDDYVVAGVDHSFDVSARDSASIETDLVLLKVPAGF